MLNRLFVIKVVHTVVFYFMCACLLYILYCGITGTFNWALLVAIAAIFLEGLALLLNRGRCPFTTLAEKHGAGKGSVTDMFLPLCIARNVFRVSTVLFSFELALLAFRYFTKL